MLLVFAMLLPMFEGLGSVVTATDGGEETVYVLAGSDFQDSTDELSAENVSAILKRVFAAGYTSFDGFMFCGDYSNQSAWTKENSGSGLDKLKGTVEGKFGTIPNQYYVQGNHDPSDTPGLSQSIGYETDHYSVLSDIFIMIFGREIFGIRLRGNQPSFYFYDFE